MKHSLSISILICCLLWTQPCRCQIFGCITNDNFIAFREGFAPVEAIGLQFSSPGGHLIPIPGGADASAAPFQRLLSNSANEVVYANVEGTVTLEPGLVLSVGYLLGQNFDLYAGFGTEEGVPVPIFIQLLGGPGALCTLLPGDLNKDGTVNKADVDLFAKDVGHEPGWNYEFDTDLDSSGGLVDQDDLELFLSGDFLSDGNILNGDANFSGTVDFPDFLILSANYGQDGKKWSQGDFAVNGKVEFEDFLVLSANYGQTSKSIAQVPEPDVRLLVAGGLLSLCRRRCRSRSGITIRG